MIFEKIKKYKDFLGYLITDDFFTFISKLDVKIGLTNNDYYYLYKQFEKYDNYLPKIIVGQEEHDYEIDIESEEGSGYEKGDYVDYCDGPTVATEYALTKWYIVNDKVYVQINGKKLSRSKQMENKEKYLKDFEFVGTYRDIMLDAKSFLKKEYEKI